MSPGGKRPDQTHLKRLALHDRHMQAGARMAPFANWQMPLQYQGILAEHEAVRTRAGVFDVSHLGRVRVRGHDAGRRIRSITTYDVLRMRVGTAHYSLYCTDDGGIADDVFIYRIAEDDWLIVHNAANAAPDFARVADAAGDAAEELTEQTVMLAVQGPRAAAALREVLGPAFDDLRPRRCREFVWRGGTMLAARTGYTGEDGAECIVETALGAELWEAFLAVGVTPVGLGARDTLRLEAALPLHGHDITESTHPYEAGLGWTVSLDDEQPFTGRNALERLQSTPSRRRLSHLQLLDRGVSREGYPVLDAAGEPVATLTSGTFSPTLRVGIGIAYLPVELASPGSRLAVEIRGRTVPAEVVPRPFYRRSDG